MNIARLSAFSAGIIALVTAIAVQGSGEADRAADSMRAACAGCHGEKGEGLEARSAPRLAGLQAAYLERQLSGFATDLRGAHRADPFGPQMAVIARTLKPEDIQSIAAYYNALGEVRPFQTLKGNAANGKRLFESCAACHGPDGMGLDATNAPRIAGQSDWYIVRSLELYRSGARGGDPADSNGQAMTVAAKALADPVEIRDVSTYTSRLGRR